VEKVGDVTTWSEKQIHAMREAIEPIALIYDALKTL
jgi:hypothetical protein